MQRTPEIAEGRGMAAGRAVSAVSDPSRLDAGATEKRSSARPRVGIVILNWNRPDDTSACLESLARVEYSPFEVLVVDNGAADNSVAILRQRFPNLELIE